MEKLTIKFKVNISTDQIIIHALDELKIDDKTISFANTQAIPTVLNPALNVSRSKDENHFLIITLMVKMTQYSIHLLTCMEV
jgi:hypothetical protein